MVFDQGFTSLVIGSGFHDIGKVWLRTGQPDLRERARQYCLAPDRHRDFGSCPHCSQEYGYLHALLGHIAALDCVPEPWRQRVANLVAVHHRGGGLGRDAKILVVADRLSAAERVEAEEAAGEHRQLRSLLTDISPDGPVTGLQPRYFPLTPLALDRPVPIPRPATSPNPEADYARLWSGLVGSLKAVGEAYAGDPEGYLAGFFTVLQLHLWAVPSAYYQDTADISLFEHLRTTAAFAAALYRSGVSEAELDRALGGSDYSGLRFDLIAGDVSGVQAFLYTLTSRAVARGLRGRSFYLDMVTDLSARWVLRELGLPVCNLLYAGGGRFYILAHPVPDDEFDRIRRELSGAFLSKFEGQLYLALARVRLSGPDVREPERYAGKWARELGFELGRAKDRRFAEAGVALFVPQGGGPPEQPVLAVAAVGREGVPPSLLSNLGVAIAQEGGPVLLLDADFLRPALHEVFSLPLSPGLGELAGQEETPSRQGTAQAGLYLIPAGKPLSLAAQAPALRRLAGMLPEMGRTAGGLLVRLADFTDAPEGLFVAEAAGAVLLVARAGRARLRKVRRVLEALAGRAQVVGVALWSVERSRRKDERRLFGSVSPTPPGHHL